jgi:hypothetical protein
VLFTPNGSSFVLFFHDKVYTKKAEPNLFDLPTAKRVKVQGDGDEDVFLWSLFDYKKAVQPETCLVELPCCPVQTCSPNLERYKIWLKEHGPRITGFPRWTEDELRQAYVLVNMLSTHD